MGVIFVVLAAGSALVLGPGLVAAVVAHRKGYRPWFWILSAGLLGMLVILIIPRLSQVVTPEEHERWESRADWTGGLLSAFTFLFMMAFPMLGMLIFMGAWIPVPVNAPGPNPPPQPFLLEEGVMTTIETPDDTPQARPSQQPE